jgi:hypothetical protein
MEQNRFENLLVVLLVKKFSIITKLKSSKPYSQELTSNL